MNQSIQDIAYWDKKLSWVTTFFFIGSCANASLKTVLPIPESLWPILSALVGIGIIGGYVSCFREMYRRSSNILRMSISLFGVIYLYSAFLCLLRGEPVSPLIKGNAFLTFAWWIPTGVFICSVKDKEILYSVWVKASYIISFFTILMFFFHIPSERNDGANDYNMAFGFYIILPLLIQATEYLRNKKIWLLLLIVLEILMVLIYASRGVLLSIIFYAVYKFAFESESRIRKIIASIILILFVVILLSSIQAVAESTIAILDLFGLQSRTLDMLAGGVIDDTSGRNELWDICFNMIGMHPLTGWGLGGEHCYLANAFDNTSPEDVVASSYHPHNGLVQNFVCFGVIGGLVANIIVLLPLLHLKARGNSAVHDLLVVFISASIIPICISASFFFTNPSVAVCLYLFYTNQLMANNL